MAGVTDEGFVRKTYAAIASEVKAELRRTISPSFVLDSSTPSGNIVHSFASQLAEAWEVLEDAHGAFDDTNATGNSMVAIGRLTGTIRKERTRGSVNATVNLDGGKTYLAGDLVAHEDGNAENRWYNLNDITTSSGAAANYSVPFVSEAFGSSAEVGAGDLTEIAETVLGWNSVTNASAATPGEDTETIEQLRARRRNELQQAGSATAGAVRAALSALDGMLDAECYENTTDVAVGGVGPHGLHPIVWDGSAPAVADNAIAQAIHDTASGGIRSWGATSGTATAYNGDSKAVAFDRATEKTVEVNVDITSASTVAASDVRAAILEAFSEMQSEGIIDQDVIYRRLDSSAFNVDGVDDVPTFQIRFTGDAWGTANLTVADDEAATLVTGDITVTGDVT